MKRRLSRCNGGRRPVWDASPAGMGLGLAALRRVNLGWLLSFGLLIGACGASVNPAFKAQIDTRIAAAQQSDSRFAASAETNAGQLKAGTWALYKLTNNKQRPSLVTYKILSEDHGAYWIETISESYTGRLVQLMKVYFGPGTPPSEIRVDQVLQKHNDDDVTHVPTPLLRMMGGVYGAMLKHLTTSWQGSPQEDITVRAGTFEQAYRIRSEVAFGPMRSTSDVWYHSEAPVGGTVKTVSIENGSMMELLDFGANPSSEIPIP